MVAKMGRDQGVLEAVRLPGEGTQGRVGLVSWKRQEPKPEPWKQPTFLGKTGKEEPGDTEKGPPPLEPVNTGASPGWKDGSTTSEIVILRALASTFPL